MKSKSVSLVLVAMMTLPSISGQASISIKANPYFKFELKRAENPTGAPTRTYCRVTDNTRQTPVRYERVPLEQITIKDENIVFQRKPNGMVYSIYKHNTRIDCFENIVNPSSS